MLVVDKPGEGETSAISSVRTSKRLEMWKYIFTLSPYNYGNGIAFEKFKLHIGLKCVWVNSIRSQAKIRIIKEKRKI